MNRQKFFLILALSLMTLGFIGISIDLGFMIYGVFIGMSIIFLLTVYKIVLVLKGKEKLGIF